MSANADTISRPDYRVEALLCAINKCSSVTSDLLSRHPNRDLLRQQAADCEPRPLSRLLWQELVDDERACLGPRGAYYVDPAEGTAAQYWQRRLRLTGWRQRRSAAARLSAPWPQIFDMPSPAARQLCLAIGTEMIIRAYARHPLQKVVPYLGPLGQELGCRVLERLRNSLVTPPSPAIVQRWRDAFLRIGRDITGDRIPLRLGTALLATLFHRLPDEVRLAAIAASRSKLPETLQQDSLLEPATSEELLLAHACTTALLPRERESLSLTAPADAGGKP